MTQSTTGKLVLHYVGEYGRHSELYIDNELIVASFNCDKSIMLLLWCACDMANQDINDYIDADFTYEHTELGAKLCRSIFKMKLFSKYDILMKPNATAYAYKDIVYKQKLTPTAVLSARRDLILHVQNKYDIDNLEVVYELDENEIYTHG